MKYQPANRASVLMKVLLFVIALSSLIPASPGKDVVVADEFILSLPESARELKQSEHSYGIRDTILQKYQDDSFQLHVYRWPSVKAPVPLRQIPEEWAKGKQWASISAIAEGKTGSGIPYVTFTARMLRDERPPFDSEMTVLRSSSGQAYMFQMTGDKKTIDTIRNSIKNK